LNRLVLNWLVLYRLLSYLLHLLLKPPLLKPLHDVFNGGCWAELILLYPLN
jgi:hypothetical protein